MLQDFAAVSVAAREKMLIEKYNSGWMRLYTYTQKLEDNDKSLDLLAKVLSVELSSAAPRSVVLTRIHMRFAAMRQRLEYVRLIKKAKA